MNLEVSRLKFAREMARLAEAGTFVRTRGWEVVRAEYPLLEVVFSHSRSGRRIGFRFSFDGWDQEPPSLVLFEPAPKNHGAGIGDGVATGKPATMRILPWSKWPQTGWNAGEHPRTGQAFLCLPGIREYHTHPNHLQDLWAPLAGRDSYRLLELVDRVHQKFEVSNG